MIYALFGLVLLWNGISLYYNWHKFWARWALLSVLTGCLMNGAVVMANGGHMPVSGFYKPLEAGDWAHRLMQPNSHLKFLADVHGPAKLRYSLGDVFLFSGLGFLVISWIRREK